MKRNKFSLSYTNVLSCDMGELVPIGITETLPGDSFMMSTQALVRAAPLVAPVMHPVYVRIHHWFVPWRLVWDNFENMITGGPDGLNASVWPTSTNASGFSVGSLGDYLGLPTSVPNITYSALAHRAYALIWNEWYRDQDLQTPLVVSTADGSDTTTNATLQNCAWEKDYFTSARPWEQKGPAVTIPIGGQAPVKGLGLTGTTAENASAANVRETPGAPPVTYPTYTTMNAATQIIKTSGGGASTYPQVFADLSAATGITVNQLRQSLAIQRYEENAARYGSRYTEYLRRLGVTSSDARLNRPEYLGGGRNVIQFSEVLQTANDVSPGTGTVGNMKGHGITALRSNAFKRFFEEHGYIITLLSCKPKTMYMNGMFRQWNRRTKTDVWQPELMHIGQQQILNKEVYAAHAQPDGVFGYQDRYDEYRRSESRVSGEFRTLLDFWHMARSFASAPALNASFVSSVPTKRNFAVQTNDILYVQCRHNIRARRLLSKTGSSFTF